MRLVPHSGLANGRLLVASKSGSGSVVARAIATAGAACQKANAGPDAGDRCSAAAYGRAKPPRQERRQLRATAMPDDHLPPSPAPMLAACPPAPLAGRVAVPGDKSISHRA